MNTKKPRSLEKQEVVTVNIPIETIVIGSFIFSVIFILIGLATRHYVPMGV